MTETKEKKKEEEQAYTEYPCGGGGTHIGPGCISGVIMMRHDTPVNSDKPGDDEPSGIPPAPENDRPPQPNIEHPTSSKKLGCLSNEDFYS